MTPSRSPWAAHRIVGALAVAFGALTIVSGGTALFGGQAVQAAVGQAVPFVLWFNVLSGFAYVLAGVGIALRRPWATALAVAIALAILAIFALFGWHIARGGAYEMRTLGAMTLRAGVWIAIALYLLRTARAGRTP